MKPDVVSLILAFVLSVSYAFLSFYMVFINSYVFYVMCALPLILLAFILIRDNLRK